MVVLGVSIHSVVLDHSVEKISHPIYWLASFLLKIDHSGEVLTVVFCISDGEIWLVRGNPSALHAWYGGRYQKHFIKKSSAGQSGLLQLTIYAFRDAEDTTG